MNRIYKKNKAFKSKKQYGRSMHGPGLATSTSTSTGTTDPASSCDSELDETTSAQVAAGVTVSIQFRSSHLISIDLLLSSRPPIVSESLPRFPPWRLVIFLL